MGVQCAYKIFYGGFQKMKRQYTFIGENGGFKTFTSYRKMKAWAEDPAHEGTYYISAPNITFKKTRLQVLSA